MRKVVSLLMALVMTLSVCSVTAWAEGDIDAAGANVAGVYNVSDDAVVSNYATLQAAIDAAGADQYVKLLVDVVSDTKISIAKSLTLDLNGKKLTGAVIANSKNKQERIALTASAGTVVIKNGVIDGRVNAYDAVDLTIASDVTITNSYNPESGDCFGIVVWGDGVFGEEGCKTPQLSVSGKIIMDKGGTAISTNGTDKSRAQITIEKDAEISASDVDGAIYLPSGKLTINGGTITGGTGIQICSGGANITTEFQLNGGTIVAKGSDARATKTGDGLILDGAAVSVVNRNYPNGIPTVEISGGTFTSEQGNAVMAYTWSNNSASEWFGAKEYIAVSGGTFSDLSAVKYAADGATIKLANDVTVSETVKVQGNLTIDLNGKTITGKNGDAGRRVFHILAGDSLTLAGTGTVTTAAGNDNAFTNNSSVIRVGDEKGTDVTSALTIGTGVNVIAPASYGVTVFGEARSTLTVKGTIKATEASAISGNGLERYGDTIITINDGAVVESTNGVAIYHPQKGTLTIGAATITGKGGVEVKSGEALVKVDGAKITATGDVDHSASNDGTSTTGYAVAVVENKNYKGTPTFTIEKGTFKGAVGIVKDNEVSDAAKLASLTIKGGTFSDGNPLPYVDADNYAVTKNVNDEYVVSEKSHGDDGTTAADSVVVIEANASTTDKEMVSKTIDKSDIHTDMELVVKTASGDEKKQTSVTLNQAAVAAVGNGEDLTLTVKDVTAETKASDDKNSAAYGKGMSGKKADSALVVQVELKKGADKVFTTKTDNAYADVSVFYGKGLGAGTVHVYYLNGSSIQELTSVAALSGVDQFVYDGGTGVVTMRLAHFSEYLIATETTTSGGSSSGGGTASIPVTSGNGQNKKAGDVVSVTMQSGSKVAVVYVDGVALSAKDYVVSGSSVRVQGTYTAKLAQGTHVLHVVYNDGRTATATFTINGSTSPKTFDAGVAVYVGMALMSVAGGALVIGKKKEF